MATYTVLNSRGQRILDCAKTARGIAESYDGDLHDAICQLASAIESLVLTGPDQSLWTKESE